MAKAGLAMARESMPDRRRSWTQHVRIEGQSCYLTVGEYPDGRPGEIFLDVAKCGSFVRGALGDLARAVSVALQLGVGVERAAYMLRGADYSPRGPVSGSPNVQHCESVTDWVASELEAAYLRAPAAPISEGDPPAGKAAGHIPESWRSGV